MFSAIVLSMLLLSRAKGTKLGLLSECFRAIVSLGLPLPFTSDGVIGLFYHVGGRGDFPLQDTVLVGGSCSARKHPT